jgi:multidrug/hemolysin transport system permease protein
MIMSLARRHLRLFFRDRMAVFFSLLSPLIMLVLYMFFLGNVQVEDLTKAFPQTSTTDIGNFVTSWVLAGIVMITTLTTGLAALSVFVEDRASDRFKDFAVSPVTKRQLILGYLSSTFLIALIMSTIVLAISQVYMVISVGGPLSAQNLATAFGYMVVLCAGFAAFSSFLVTFVKTTAAFTALSVIVGTVVGFLAGIYIQPGSLSMGVVNTINSLPFSEGAALIREPFTEATARTLAHNNPEIISKLYDHYGIGSLHIGDYILGVATIVFIFIGIAVVFTVLGAWRLKKKIG